MTASAVIAASVVAANAGTAKASSAVLMAIITAAASFSGTALAAWISLRIAGQRMQHERRQEAVKRAFDSAGSHMAVIAFDKYVQFCEEYTELF
jgi:hypothetical protein